eukprot:CCRYP_011071-RA/>CCRYP_011071-RA protein AED:0.41 eAED:0.41 QI:267/1/1/1/0/0/2/409/159
MPHAQPTAQRVMGIVFAAMGAITMMFPRFVLDFCFPRDFLLSPSNSCVVSPSTSFSPLLSYAPILLLLVRCFGSQACLCGLLILTTTFNKRTNLYFGLAMIPYLLFDFVGYINGALTLLGAIGDALGNLVFVACCFLGYHKGDVQGCDSRVTGQAKKEQ